MITHFINREPGPVPDTFDLNKGTQLRVHRPAAHALLEHTSLPLGKVLVPHA